MWTLPPHRRGGRKPSSPTYFKKKVFIKKMHTNILFKCSNCYKTLENTIQMNRSLKIVTSIHIYEAIKCSFSDPEKRRNGWRNTEEEREKTWALTHGPGSELDTECTSGPDYACAGVRSGPACVISCSVFARLISVLPHNSTDGIRLPWEREAPTFGLTIIGAFSN